MKTIILSGYSLRNRDWGIDVAQEMNSVKDADLHVLVHEWLHWGGEIEFSIGAEVERVLQEIGNEEFNIIAKSVGTLVLAKLLSGGTSKVNKIVLCGIPINDISDDEKKEYVSYAKISPKKIICFQNANDPHGNFEQVKKFLITIDLKFKIIEKPSETHEYPYTEKFVEFLTS